MNAPLEFHTQGSKAATDAAAREESLVRNFAGVQLVIFVAIVVFGTLWLSRSTFSREVSGALFALSTVAFIVGRVLQARAIGRRDRADMTRELHERHLARSEHRWERLPPTESRQPEGHAYAHDIDIHGSDQEKTATPSLLARMDVCRTDNGLGKLTNWLSELSPVEEIRARQAAARELADNVAAAFNIELTGALASKTRIRLPSAVGLDVETTPPLRADFISRIAVFAIPIASIAIFTLASAGVLRFLWLVPIGLAGAVVTARVRPTTERLFTGSVSEVGAWSGIAKMLHAFATNDWKSPFLSSRAEKIRATEPGTQLQQIELWLGFAEVRTQFPFNLIASAFFVWDIICGLMLERALDKTRSNGPLWLAVIGEVEAASGLACLARTDSGATFPEITDEPSVLLIEQLAHPLLPPGARVAYDVDLSQPQTLWIVTGSNMAGKSTLLRAVGTNVALALAGGPVIGRNARVSAWSLRTCMRVQDSLKRHASYYRAELDQLARVIEDVLGPPPALFLLDELLRGTNAAARRVGARAIVGHLLIRGASGIVATHDTTLTNFSVEHASVRNVHFTDTLIEGEMRFDYALREGVVKTSNALALLRGIGIDVDDEVLD